MDIQAKNKTKEYTINKEVFRAYDIRGQIGKDWCLDDDYQDAYLIGQAIGAQLVKRNSPNIILGFDGRTSSQMIRELLIYGLTSVGCNVTDIGLTATPVVYFTLSQLNIPNSVMVTGSHNPPDHNGLKIVYESTPLTAVEIETLYFNILKQDFPLTKTGKYVDHTGCNLAYQQAIINNIKLDKSLRIGIDCSNGATSLFAESLFSQLGCEVYPLFCELDGTFPNHSPDPTVPENLKPLIKLVKKENLDIGIAFDGDGDRMIAVDNQGNILWPDRIMILLAQDVIKTKPNAKIVYDVKCSFLLPKAVNQFGGQTSMCISGHSTVKIQMQRLDATMGGEFSGHIIMRDRWSDFDDGPYVAARLLELISQSNESSREIFEKIPNCYSTPEYKLALEHTEQAKKIVEEFIQKSAFSDVNLSLIDGLRVDFEDGWGLLRSSNTSAGIGFRFEATTTKRLDEIKKQFRQVYKSTGNKQELPF